MRPGHEAYLMVLSIFSFPHLLRSAWLHIHTAACSSRLLAAGCQLLAVPPASTVMPSSSIPSVPGGFQKRPQIAKRRNSTLACLSLPISLHFSHHNGANVQPCGQPTARLRALCKLYDGETIACFTHRGNEVVL